jgi:DegV family protein with EDD domain
MSKVAIITDSTAYIPTNLVKENFIHVAPQVLIWGEEEFADGVDILPDEFYSKLSSAKVMPSTSQVTPKSFINLFSELSGQGYDILAILISEFLSGTISSAKQAKEMLPESRIEIIDSKTTAMALGFIALTAARAAKKGASLQECHSLVENARERVGVVFAVNTLEFLHRGGRIGGAQKFLASALNIKPILEVTGGRVEAVERVRTRSKSLARLVELVEERSRGQKPIRLATLHANCKEDAENILELASKQLQPVETILSEVSPVIGTHAGPGTVGLAFMAGE